MKNIFNYRNLLFKNLKKLNNKVRKMLNNNQYKNRNKEK